MHKSITPETFQGLNWNAAKHDFSELAKEYGRSVSAAAFDAWCAKHSPSSVDNTHRWHSASSIRRFLAEFDQEKTLLRRLLAIENARRKGKRASMNAYDASGAAKKTGNGTRKGNGSRKRTYTKSDLTAMRSEINLLDQLIERRVKLDKLSGKIAA